MRGKGCLAAVPENRPFSAFFALFLPFSFFSGGPEQYLKNSEKARKDLFPQISSDLLKPPSLKLPFAASQLNGWNGSSGSGFRFLRFFWGGGFLWHNFNREGQFRFLKNGSGGSSSAFGSWEDGSDGSNFRS